MAEVRDFLSYTEKLNNKGSGNYESDDQPSYKEKIRNHKLAVLFRTLGITLGVLAFVVVVYVSWRDKLYTEAVITEGLSITNGADSYVMALSDHVIQYSKDGISCVDAGGNAVWNQTYEMQNPIARTCGNVVAVGDYNGHNIFVNDIGGTLGEVDTNLPIRDFCVSMQGVVATILDGTDVTWIYLYDAKGNTLASFKTTMKDSGYPIDIGISPNGELVCVSYLYPEEGNLKTSVAFFNFGSVGQNSIDNYVSGYDYPGSVVPYVQFMDGKSAFAVSDDRVMFYTGSEKPVSQAEIFTGDEQIKSVYSGDNYMGLVFANSTDDGAYRLQVYNTSGELVLTTYFDIEYTEVIFKNKQIVIYNEDECIIQDMAGHVKYTGNFFEPVRLMVSTAQRNKFTLVTESRVESMLLK